MYSGIHNFSEIGKLNKVLLHRPGEELESLTPATLERLLFDDIPYLKVAQEEHDRFAEVLRENGVEVIYYVDEVAKAIADPARQIQLVNDFLNISKIHAKGLRASMTSLLLDMPPKQMVTKMIAGIKRCEVATKQPTSLMDLVDDDYPFVSDPMPNLYFTRDPGACVGEGINIHRMHTPARKRESLLLKYMFLYNRDFATQDNKMWYDLSDSYSIEGGDVLVLSKDIVAVGLSERTTVSGAETFARNLLQNSDFKKVLAFDIPETRAFMHLDTVFTMVDYDKFTIHPEIEGPLSVYEMTLDEHGELRFGAIKEELKDILALELKLPAVDLIRCGGGDLMAAAGGEGEVLFDPHRGGGAHHRVLEHAADECRALVLGQVRDVGAVDDDLAGVDKERAGGGVEHRGLARAVAADDGDEVAVVQRQTQAVQRGFGVDGAGVKGLIKFLEFKHGHCLRSLRSGAAPCGGTSCSSSRGWRGRPPRSAP